jgi:plastocyanin
VVPLSGVRSDGRARLSGTIPRDEARQIRVRWRRCDTFGGTMSADSSRADCQPVGARRVVCRSRTRPPASLNQGEIMARFSRPTVFVAALAFCTVVACGDDGTGPDDTVTIEMRDNTFSPATRAVDVGTTVRWVNEGTVQHNTTGEGGVWQSSNLNPDQSFQRTFSTAGTFDYECTLHEGMTGTITVD